MVSVFRSERQGFEEQEKAGVSKLSKHVWTNFRIQFPLPRYPFFKKTLPGGYHHI